MHLYLPLQEYEPQANVSEEVGCDASVDIIPACPPSCFPGIDTTESSGTNNHIPVTVCWSCLTISTSPISVEHLYTVPMASEQFGAVIVEAHRVGSNNLILDTSVICSKVLHNEQLTR